MRVPFIRRYSASKTVAAAGCSGFVVAVAVADVAEVVVVAVDAVVVGAATGVVVAVAAVASAAAVETRQWRRTCA